jgi:hypothetical protein
MPATLSSRSQLKRPFPNHLVGVHLLELDRRPRNPARALKAAVMREPGYDRTDMG